MGKTIWVAVVSPGKDDDEAHNNCRNLPAYRQILTKYPAELWHRRWRCTYPHTEGLWYVEFELEPRTLPLAAPAPLHSNPARSGSTYADF